MWDFSVHWFHFFVMGLLEFLVSFWVFDYIPFFIKTWEELHRCQLNNGKMPLNKAHLLWKLSIYDRPFNLLKSPTDVTQKSVQLHSTHLHYRLLNFSWTSFLHQYIVHHLRAETKSCSSLYIWHIQFRCHVTINTFSNEWRSQDLKLRLMLLTHFRLPSVCLLACFLLLLPFFFWDFI